MKRIPRVALMAQALEAFYIYGGSHLPPRFLFGHRKACPRRYCDDLFLQQRTVKVVITNNAAEKIPMLIAGNSLDPAPGYNYQLTNTAFVQGGYQLYSQAMRCSQAFLSNPSSITLVQSTALGSKTKIIDPNPSKTIVYLIRIL